MHIYIYIYICIHICIYMNDVSSYCCIHTYMYIAEDIFQTSFLVGLYIHIPHFLLPLPPPIFRRRARLQSRFAPKKIWWYKSRSTNSLCVEFFSIVS